MDIRAAIDIEKFQQAVWQYYDQYGRHDLPWRQPEPDGEFDPYKIMVSEVMLQQTQVGRVIPKYLDLIRQFPAAADIATAPLGDVLIAWQGLGYNRRAKFLWRASQMVVQDYGGVFPNTQKELGRLPGVGVNTAGAIAAYAYNTPVVFLETNIRTVFIHHFFEGQAAVDDKAIASLVQQTLPHGEAPGMDPRNWYWALVDYGTSIKKTYGNKSRASKSYARQSRFQGSRRQVRGAVIRYLSQQPDTFDGLMRGLEDDRLPEVINELLKESLIKEDQGYYRLA